VRYTIAAFIGLATITDRRPSPRIMRRLVMADKKDPSVTLCSSRISDDT